MSIDREYERPPLATPRASGQHRPRILAFGAAMAIVALMVAIVTQPLYGAIVLMLDVILARDSRKRRPTRHVEVCNARIGGEVASRTDPPRRKGRLRSRRADEPG